LFVAYYRRALPRFLKVKSLIDGGEIGDIRFVSVLLQKTILAEEADEASRPWRVKPEISGGGHFVDMGSHMLDYLDFVLGPIRSVSGFASNQAGAYPAEDAVVAAFEFDSGVQGVGVWNSASYAGADRIEFVGSRGRIAFPCFAPEPILLSTTEGTSSIAVDDPPHVQQPLIQTVVDALNGAGACPSTGVSARRTTRVMDEILKEYGQR